MWGGADDTASIATVRAALERGINFIDTAPVYGFGRSEDVVGKALAGVRHAAVIATKCGLHWDANGRVTRNSLPMTVREEVEGSLRRLRTDYIDLYQVHWPDLLVPLEETAAELERLRREGKILAVGVSNFTPAQMEEFALAVPLVTVQPPYNLFERAIDADTLPYVRDKGLVALAYGSLCRGLLSGRMTPDATFADGDLRNVDPKFQPPRYAQYLACVEALSALARERHGKSVLALAVRWVLDQGPTVALWGARRPEQLADIDDVFGWQLSGQDRAEIDRILACYVKDPVGPDFFAPPLRAA